MQDKLPAICRQVASKLAAGRAASEAVGWATFAVSHAKWQKEQQLRRKVQQAKEDAIASGVREGNRIHEQAQESKVAASAASSSSRFSSSSSAASAAPSGCDDSMG